LKVLSLPRTLGNHPETGKPVEANVGRFGPYVKHDGAFKSIPKSESVYDITLDRAVALLAEPKAARGGPTGKHLGAHPIDNQAVVLMEGRYGPYIKHGKVNVTIPSDLDPTTLTLDDAVDLLAEKAAKELAQTGSTAARPLAAQRSPNQRGQPSRRGGDARKQGSAQANRPAGNRSGASKGKAPSHQRQPAQRGAPGRSGARRRPA
jgi:DNA topoisomerase-1